ncbi:MAG: Stp1/IreP family PP2C-type Ser/Thr phosphatase [Thermoleophilaceae bacterium]
MGLRIVEEAALTDVGRQRNANEDSFYESDPVFAVADGMGGARAGEVASRIAVEEFDQTQGEGTSPEETLAEIARSANKRIYELAQRDETHAGMGTTLIAAMVSGNEVAIGHVGDSRAYRFRDDELERLTQDHSLVEELRRQGKLTEEQAEVHPQRSIITRALGPEPDVEVDTFSFPAREGDVYLLCSDGLTGMVSEARIAEILRVRSSLQQAAETLVAEANARGGRDNITVVLFKLGSDDARDEESDTLSGQKTSVAVGDGAAAGPDPALETMAIPAAEANAARTAVAEREAPPAAEPPAAEPRPSRRPRRAARWLKVAVGVLVVAAVLAGLWIGSRQFWFVGTDKQGAVTLFKGLPYELPLGIKLYTEEYQSSVPALSLPKLQRKRVLDHQLRGRSDAVDLVRSLEQAHAS